MKRQVQAIYTSEALFRFQVVSGVVALERQGWSRAQAIDRVLSRPHYDIRGQPRRVSSRSVYRWLQAYVAAVDELDGKPDLDGLFSSRVLSALERKRRPPTSSCVIPTKFLHFCRTQKMADCYVSIPELIRRGEAKGLLSSVKKVCRVTVYRALRRFGVPVCRRKGKQRRDTRRYAFPHRLQCVLVDGKHFRAGQSRAKRVALFFIDDSSRFFLHVVVGTSENKYLVLRGLYEVIKKWGFFGILFLDRGSGFICDELHTIVSRMPGMIFVHGEAGYPEGHGKIEAFNKSAKSRVIRGLDGRPDVDPSCEALALRLQHYGAEVYNHLPHEGLDQKTPHEVFFADEAELEYPEDLERLKDYFVLFLDRLVSKDHVVSVDDTPYEVPIGLSGTYVRLFRRMFDGSVHLLHKGRAKQIHPVDLTDNARSKRATSKQKQEPVLPIPPSAADMAYSKTFRPVVGPDGGFPKEDK